MKILSRPGMPSKTEIPAPLEVRRAAAKIIRAGRYDEEELEDALVLIGGYLWETPDSDKEEGKDDDSWFAMEQRLRSLQARRRGREESGFIGRQVPAGDAGTLDLITDWSSGELTIYELKAREIQVGDLAQVASYREALDEFDPDDIAWLLVIGSGRNGIPRIWNAEDLRSRLDHRDDDVIDNEKLLGYGDSDYDPDLRRISCAVVGPAWKARVAHLADSMGIELIHVPELITTALDEIAKAELHMTREEQLWRKMRGADEEEEDDED